MSSCHDCGLPVPDGQTVCSRCYGDPYYGSDGYYLAELEAQRIQEEAQAAQEMEWLADGPDPNEEGDK